MNALASNEVGDYLNRHFVAAYQKVATFEIRGGAKVGGNVASYFCTPDGSVLHAVAGPTDAATLLREARWANETYQMARMGKAAPGKVRDFFRKAHLERLRTERHVRLPERTPSSDAVTPELLRDLLRANAGLRLTDPGKVHLILAVAPLAPIDRVYQPVFEGILGEKISTLPVAAR